MFCQMVFPLRRPVAIFSLGYQIQRKHESSDPRRLYQCIVPSNRLRPGSGSLAAPVCSTYVFVTLSCTYSQSFSVLFVS